MEQFSVEVLSASLVREYLARKKLTNTLKLLDEEQVEYSSCVRSRLKLLKALHIGKLMKRNKAMGLPLDSMVEVIVHFLVDHARLSKKKQSEQNENEDAQECLVPNNNVDGEVSLVSFGEKSFDTASTKQKDQCLMCPNNSNEAGNYENCKRTDTDADSVMTTASFSFNENSFFNKNDESIDLTVNNLCNESDCDKNCNMKTVLEEVSPAVIDERGSVLGVNDFTALQHEESFGNYSSHLESSLTSVATSCCTSDFESDIESSSTESESECSAASIIDLLKEKNEIREKVSLNSSHLTFKVPPSVSMFSSGDHLEDDIELIDAEVEVEMCVSLTSNDQADGADCDDDTHASLCEEADSAGLFPNVPFGFSKGLDTCDALLAISANLQKALEFGQKACMIGFDFGTVFDHYTLEALIFELRKMDVVRSFLSTVLWCKF
ncbi:hypothetical protein SK128_012018 [Halocaridina rubra]|uniref:MINDY4 N-terminal dimerisation domain-containing protein n=1 Tax=Halocaridina rubra TaxID=373956 RepID=A0AAN8WVN0_HALRR